MKGKIIYISKLNNVCFNSFRNTIKRIINIIKKKENKIFIIFFLALH